MSIDEFIHLKSDVEELKTRIETFERFILRMLDRIVILRMLDRIVELERDRRAREAADQADSADEGSKP